MFVMTKNHGQTENIFDWLEKPSLIFFNDFIFYFFKR